MREHKWILDEDGMPVPEPDAVKWALWMDVRNRVVKQEYVNGYFVSTVFLALDNSFGYGPPILWETMVFTHPDREAQWSGRCSTREQALELHERGCAFARELKP